MMLNYFVGVDYFTWAIAGTVFVVGIGTIVALVQVSKARSENRRLDYELELTKSNYRDLGLNATKEILAVEKQLHAFQTKLEIAANELFIARQDEAAALETLREQVFAQETTFQNYKTLAEHEGKRIDDLAASVTQPKPSVKKVTAK